MLSSSSLSVTETFDQMSIASRRTTVQPHIDAFVNSNYRCLSSSPIPLPLLLSRYHLCHYLVLPFTTTTATVAVATTSLSILKATAMTASTAFARRGQCQHAHYRYVVHPVSKLPLSPLVIFPFLLWIRLIVFSVPKVNACVCASFVVFNIIFLRVRFSADALIIRCFGRTKILNKTCFFVYRLVVNRLFCLNSLSLSLSAPMHSVIVSIVSTVRIC